MKICQKTIQRKESRILAKAKKLLHWEPRVGLEEGLKKTIEYFKELNQAL